MSDADDFMTRYLNNITSQYESSRFKPEYEPAEPETTKVTCRDGVELTVDIFRPATPGPYPTIVVRCPYPQQVELWKLHGEHLNRRGYAMVCEWCRGTYTSGGTWEPNVNERNDGADLLAWCEHQDWIDVIGLWGTSYLSLTCWTVADITTPKVASICANHYGTDRFASAYQKGLLPLRRAHRLGHAERRISGRRRLHEIRPPPAADERGRGHVGRPP